MGENTLLGFFQKINDLRTRHRWKTFKKVINRLSVLDIIHEGLNGDSRTPKNRRTPHNIRTGNDNLGFHLTPLYPVIKPKSRTASGHQLSECQVKRLAR